MYKRQEQGLGAIICLGEKRMNIAMWIAAGLSVLVTCVLGPILGFGLLVGLNGFSGSTAEPALAIYAISVLLMIGSIPLSRSVLRALNRRLDVTDWIRVPLAVIGTGAIILLVLVVLFFAMLLLTSYRHNTR